MCQGPRSRSPQPAGRGRPPACGRAYDIGRHDGSAFGEGPRNPARPRRHSGPARAAPPARAAAPKKLQRHTHAFPRAQHRPQSRSSGAAPPGCQAAGGVRRRGRHTEQRCSAPASMPDRRADIPPPRACGRVCCVGRCLGGSCLLAAFAGVAPHGGRAGRSVARAARLAALRQVSATEGATSTAAATSSACAARPQA